MFVQFNVVSGADECNTTAISNTRQKTASDTGTYTKFMASIGGSRLRSRQAPDNPISETFSFDWRLANATGDISSRFQQQGRSGISLSWK